MEIYLKVNNLYEKCITIKEACELIGCGKRTITRYFNNNLIKPVVIGRSKLISINDVKKIYKTIGERGKYGK